MAADSITQRKSFPSRVDWIALWQHRWTLLNFLNQVAQGSLRDADKIAILYGGSIASARRLYKAANAVIEHHPQRKAKGKR